MRTISGSTARCENETMSSPDDFDLPAAMTPDKAVTTAAQGWIIKRDRGLSPIEAAEFERWLEADPRHGIAFRSSSAAWTMLDHITPEMAQSVQFSARRKRRRRIFEVVAVAAALMIGFFVWRQPLHRDAKFIGTPAQVAGLQTLHLSDGSTVFLGPDSIVLEQFTPAERRVILRRGGAHFEVAKNPARPFVVRAGLVDVSAVGTAFNVMLQKETVEVLVTEGRVGVVPREIQSSPDAPAGAAIETPILQAGQRAIVAAPTAEIPAPVVQISTVSSAEMAHALLWQEQLLRLGGSTLAELAAEFQQLTGRSVVLGDPALEDLRIGGFFRKNDLDGFVGLLEANYGVVVERTKDGGYILRKASQTDEHSTKLRAN